MAANLGQFVDTEEWAGTVLFPTSPDVNITAEFNNLKIASSPAVPVDTNKFPAGETVLRSGGGLLNLTIDAHYELRNAGEAEWFGHQMLTQLGQSGKGYLDINNQRWESVIFERGTCKIIRAASSSLLIYNLSFIMSSPTVQALPSSTALTDTPPAYGTRTSAGDYAYGSVTLGSHAHVDSIQVTRSPLVKNIPRSTGVRLKSRRDTRSIRINVKVWERAEPDGAIQPRRKLEYNIHEAIWEVADNAIFIPKTNLVGQGNTFSNCVLDSFSPSLGDAWWTGPSDLVFTQELTQPA